MTCEVRQPPAIRIFLFWSKVIAAISIWMSSWIFSVLLTPLSHPFVRSSLVRTGGQSRDASRWSKVKSSLLLVTLVVTIQLRRCCKKRLEVKKMAICPKSCCKRLGIFRRVDFDPLICSCLVMKATWKYSKSLRSRFWQDKGKISWPPKNLKKDFSCRTRAGTDYDKHLPFFVILTPVPFWSQQIFNSWSAIFCQFCKFATFQIALSLCGKLNYLGNCNQVRFSTIVGGLWNVCKLLAPRGTFWERDFS